MQLEYEFARRTAVPARTRHKNLNTSKPKLVSIIFKNSIHTTKKKAQHFTITEVY
jgi:hypothetical protein